MNEICFMKSVPHFLKRLIQKNTIKAIRLASPPQIKSEYERDAIKICKQLLQKSDSTLLLTPISNKRYIKNDELGIFIIFDGRSINVINHVYSYIVFLDDKSWISIVSIFDNEVEKRRMEFEQEITENIKHSLQNILKKI